MTSTRAKLQAEYEQALFKVLLHDAAEQEGRALLEELDDAGHSPAHAPSELELKRFGKALDKRQRRQRQAAWQKAALSAARTTAISLLAATAVFVTAMTTVSAFRVRVMNLWMSVQPEYTSFQLRRVDGSQFHHSTIALNLSNDYVPTYVPQGYEVNSFAVNDGLKRIVFENHRTKTFIVYTEMDAASNLVVDTENATRFLEISINGHAGTLVVKNNMVTVIWSIGERMFMLKTQTTVDTAIRMARGVKFVE